MSDHTVITTTSSGQSAVGTGANLVTQIARIVGGESENPIRSQALDCLNRVRIELNQHDLRFMKRTDDPITLTDGTATYSLSSTFRKPSFAVLIDTEGNPQFSLDYMDDASSRRLDPNALSSSGQPVYYELRNDFEDGLVTLVPPPDDGTATDYRLVVEFYARIGAFSDTNEADVALPEEVTSCLVVGGQYEILAERDKTSPLIPFKFQDYQRRKKLLITHDRRNIDEHTKFRLGTRRFQPVGTLLIRA